MSTWTSPSGAHIGTAGAQDLYRNAVGAADAGGRTGAGCTADRGQSANADVERDAADRRHRGVLEPQLL